MTRHVLSSVGALGSIGSVPFPVGHLGSPTGRDDEGETALAATPSRNADANQGDRTARL